MSVRVALGMACVGALAASLTACHVSTQPNPTIGRGPGDADASVILDSDCKTLTVTDHTRGHRNKKVTWEVRSNCQAANSANAQVVIDFDKTTAPPPIANCPCSGSLDNNGKLDLAETVASRAAYGVVFKYKVTLYGASVDPDLEIDP